MDAVDRFIFDDLNWSTSSIDLAAAPAIPYKPLDPGQPKQLGKTSILATAIAAIGLGGHLPQHLT